MKITSVMLLAAYYDWLPPERSSRPTWVLIPVLMILVPTFLVLRQPDLGTSILLMAAGGGVMFLAGVHWAYFAAVIAAGLGLVAAVFKSRGNSWQLLENYQYRRIDTFLDPSQDPLGAGYHITQSKIALGSGGWSGRGYMQGTQSRLAVNMSMVMGLAPVVGVPLPLVSYGGSAMLVLLAAFGLVQSANIHRPR